jgi:hypothetical protein
MGSAGYAAHTALRVPANAEQRETFMKLIRMFATLSLALAGITVAAPAQSQDARNAIQKKLESEYALTKTTDDRSDIVTAGAVIVLQKDKLMMAAANSSTMCVNTYKEGRFTQNASCKGNAVLGRFAAFGHGAEHAATTRTFVTGEKFWVTKIDVREAGKDSAVVMDFFTDAINDVRFRSSLTIGFSDGLPASPDEALKRVQEVVKIVPSDDAKQGDTQGAPAPNAAPASDAALAPVAPPPPPPDAPPAQPPTVALGQTPDQVEAILGPPVRKATVGSKMIYSYKDLKVTFLNGKVKDIQ